MEPQSSSSSSGRGRRDGGGKEHGSTGGRHRGTYRNTGHNSMNTGTSLNKGLPMNRNTTDNNVSHYNNGIEYHDNNGGIAQPQAYTFGNEVSSTNANSQQRDFYDPSAEIWDDNSYYFSQENHTVFPDQYQSYEGASATATADAEGEYYFESALGASGFDPRSSTSAAYYNNNMNPYGYGYFENSLGNQRQEYNSETRSTNISDELLGNSNYIPPSAHYHTKSNFNSSRLDGKGHGQHKKHRNPNKKGELTEAQATFRSRIQKQQQSETKLEYENQREALIDQLISSTYECMICCSNILRRESTWNCTICFHIFHLPCIKKWANSSAIENCWRCPGCQNVVENFPKEYLCFCGKTKNPPASSGIPHSCMSVCARSNSTRADCTHSGCSILCHPGPCPACTSLVKRDCECGKTSAFVQCSSKNPILCGQVCDKLLNCNIHKCSQNCHPDECKLCEEKLVVYCRCGKTSKEVICSADWNSNQTFSCDLVCDKLLNCSNHHCPLKCCAPGQCKPCPSSVDVVLSCPCGQTSIDEACSLRNLPPRKSCLDPVPTCEKVCRKILPCGGLEKHYCSEKCHNEKTCPPCPLITLVMCRCGNQELEISCADFLSSKEFLCNKKCTKKRSCGKHKCNIRCCADLEHICPIVCNRQLKCPHKCERLCHMGYCPTCKNISFEELRCECGNAVIYPPVPCGTLPPTCDKPCQREHQCEHPPNHSCHSDPLCPPCTVLTSKWCFGNHELRKNVLCHVTKISCGMPCNKELNCNGRHKCTKICHDGPCLPDNQICRLPCLKLRKCGHKCGAPCHEEGKCPETQCKLLVPVTCNCGRRDDVMLCWKRELELEMLSDLRKVSISNGSSLENTEDKSILVEERRNRPPLLECDKECARIDRVRRMAEALQLDNPDPETRLGPPNYSEFLKKFAQKNPQFVEMVHTKLTDLVMNSKKTKKTNVTYAFDSMNREKRTVVHEYSDHFGCASESFDEEPNRNVIVTASKDRCWLPSESLVNVVFCKTLTTGRKNVYHDLELNALPKSQIIGPSNRKIVQTKATPGMVSLNGTGAWGKR